MNYKYKEIKKKDERPEFRIVQEPINNVRPFIFGEVILADHADILDPNDPKIENKLSKIYLKFYTGSVDVITTCLGSFIMVLFCNLLRITNWYLFLYP